MHVSHTTRPNLHVPCSCEVQSIPYHRLQNPKLYSHELKTSAAVWASPQLAEPAYCILPHPVFLHTHTLRHTHTPRYSHDRTEGKSCAPRLQRQKVMSVRKICPHMWKEVCMCVCAGGGGLVMVGQGPAGAAPPKETLVCLQQLWHAGGNKRNKMVAQKPNRTAHQHTDEWVWESQSHGRYVTGRGSGRLTLAVFSVLEG